ncbi:MAG TPA: pitrilysin family protein, partial [Actinomycetota bacterium]|nr:pitrilysin family protein [Actinomycetota bacterium]
MFERTELDSGVRVLSAHMPGQRSVSLGAWVAAGGRDEPADLCGASHFLEHLVFKGTPSRTALQIAEAFDAVGGDLNAFTSKEFTCFHARTLSDDLDLCVETIGDLMRNATLTPDDVDAERKVVLEEIAMHEDTPDDIIFDVFHEILWPDHALGRRVQGVPTTVEALTADALRQYYEGAYATGALVLSAAGDVDHARLVALAERAFGPKQVATGLRRPEPVPMGGPTLRIEERDIEQAHVVYGTRGIARDDERRWALAILN